MPYTYTDVLNGVEVSKTGKMKLILPYSGKAGTSITSEIDSLNPLNPKICVVEELDKLLSRVMEVITGRRNVLP